MNKFEGIEFLNLLQGKIGKYSDNAIMVDCGSFSKEDGKVRYLDSRITIRPKGMSNEKRTMEVLKELLEKSKVTSTIEDYIVKAVEEEIIKKKRELQEELRDILGMKTEKEITQGEQDHHQMMGGDTG